MKTSTLFLMTVLLVSGLGSTGCGEEKPAATPAKAEVNVTVTPSTSAPSPAPAPSSGH